MPVLLGRLWAWLVCISVAMLPSHPLSPEQAGKRSNGLNFAARFSDVSGLSLLQRDVAEGS